MLAAVISRSLPALALLPTLLAASPGSTDATRATERAADRVTDRAAASGRPSPSPASAEPAAAEPPVTSADTPRSGPTAASRWAWPLPGRPRILRAFAPPSQPWLPGHRGVDLAAPSGTPVHAAGPGTVGYAGPLAGRGVVTVLHSAGLRTTYLPVRASVRRGQVVERGEAIGTVEDAPGHCPTGCLHWGLLHDRRYLDPLLLLGHGQVRLLPLPLPTGGVP
ncbi:peptidase, M23/M37 family [Planomonospora sphaerica]|uniref:Peptidase, M23/M37 family n=1 Tax=Planomonospora sphaerica TaxID=161355 RepID=A0A171BUN5_9ACTN|nr:peptidase, M23/M37 family [Planomonospora sphaerica]